MKLTSAMKLLMQFFYTNDNAIRYEFVMNKDTNYFAARFFFNEYSYFYIEFDKDTPYICHVTEWESVKSHYHPSPRCTYLNKYFRKYRNRNKSCTLNVEDLTKALAKISKPQGFMNDRDTYSMGYSVRRASGRY